VREALSNYAKIGSPVPSSVYLARGMVEALGDVPPERPIIELGPGTGAFTRLLLETYPDHRIFGIEWNDRFARLLRERFPRLRVGVCCASKMVDYLREEGIEPGTVGGIVSGLPVTGFSKELKAGLFAAIHEALAPGARYVQFTYHRFIWKRIHPTGLVRQPYRRVWRNFPPAFVLTFHKNGKV